MVEPPADELLVIGRITGCYGIKGWVKIHFPTPNRRKIFGFGQWMLRRRGERRAYGVRRGSGSGQGLVAHIAGWMTAPRRSLQRPGSGGAGR